MKKFLLILFFATLVSGIGITSSGGGYSQHAKADWLAGNTSATRVSGGDQPVASWNNSNLCGRFGVIEAIGCPGVTGTVTPTPTPSPVPSVCRVDCDDWLWFIYHRALEIGTRLLEIIPNVKR